MLFAVTHKLLRMDMVDFSDLKFLQEWDGENKEGCCVVVLQHDFVIPFPTWEEAKAFYRARARVLDKAIAAARFFLFQEGGWDEVARPAFVN